MRKNFKWLILTESSDFPPQSLDLVVPLLYLGLVSEGISSSRAGVSSSTIQLSLEVGALPLPFLHRLLKGLHLTVTTDCLCLVLEKTLV